MRAARRQSMQDGGAPVPNPYLLLRADHAPEVRRGVRVAADHVAPTFSCCRGEPCAGVAADHVAPTFSCCLGEPCAGVAADHVAPTFSCCR
eukprot:363845-Chlamydomonas_euryale.AAC.5